MTEREDQEFPAAEGSTSETRIVKEFGSFRAFIEAVSPSIAEEGMFLDRGSSSGELPRVGEIVGFELRLSDDFRLIHGRGQVAWIRKRGSAEGDQGVAIRFLELDEPGRRLVTRLVTNFVKDGGEPFSLGPAEPSEARSGESEQIVASEADELFPEEDRKSESEQVEVEDVKPGGDAGGRAEQEGDEGPRDEHPASADLEEVPSGDLEETLELPVGLEPMESVVDSADESAVAEAGETVDEEPAKTSVEAGDGESAGQLLNDVEMPSEEDLSGLADETTSKAERSSWRRLLYTSLAAIVLGIVVWYFFDDQLRGLLRTSRDEPLEVATSASAEPEPQPPDRVVDDQAGGEPMLETTVGEAGETREPTVEAVASDEADASGVATSSDEPLVAAQPQQDIVREEVSREVEGETTDPRPISRVEDISWKVTEAETVVTIRVDGLLGEDSYEIVRIREGAPRELIKIFGVTRSYSPKVLEVGTDQVVRLRMGLHAGDGEDELHVVADLTGAAAAVTLVRSSGDELIVTFS